MKNSPKKEVMNSVCAAEELSPDSFIQRVKRAVEVGRLIKKYPNQYKNRKIELPHPDYFIQDSAKLNIAQVDLLYSMLCELFLLGFRSEVHTLMVSVETIRNYLKAQS